MSQNNDEKLIKDLQDSLLEDSKKIINNVEVPSMEFNVSDSEIPMVNNSKMEVPKENDSNNSGISNGYNPDIKKPSQEMPSSDFTGDNIKRNPAINNNINNNNINNQPGAGAPIQQPSRRETAPDIGKNYGDGLGAPGYDNRNVYPNDGTSVDIPERQNPVSNQPTNQLLATQNDGLGKKDGLDNKDDLGNKNNGLEKKDNLDNKDSSKDNGNKDQKSNSSNLPSEQDSKNQQNNGYGALNKGNKTNGLSDSTERARQNLAHNNKVQQAKQGEKSAKPSQNAGVNNRPRVNSINDSQSGLSSLGSRLRNAISGLGSGNKGKGSAGNSKSGNKNGGAKDKAINTAKKKVLEFLVAHPYIAIVIGVVIIIFLILVISNLEEEASKGKKKGAHCTYNLSGVSMAGEVKLEGIQVELINCDGTASNYTVLETVDFEKYVLGVALAEIGPDSPDEAIKAQIVAARGFALTRNSGMCPSNQDDCFYGYNTSTGKIRMRACEADQVYWDYEKDIYRQNRGSISIYSPEINSGTLWKSALSESKKQHVLELADEVKGKVLIDEARRVVSTSYVASTSTQFINLANEGKDFEQILGQVYSNSDGFSSGECSSYGNIDYGDYVLSSEGDEILHQPLGSFLISQGSSIEEFSELIASNVEKAGYGTRAGVVAAGVTLIAELGNNYDVKIPYYWGGGHYDGVVDGALDYWGSSQCHTYANGQSYNYCGFDCSGFVPWAIKNGGFNIAQMLAGQFKNLSGAKKVSLSNSPVLEPGDLLESSEHIVLVIGIEESTNSYICAEASGNSSGVLFTRRAFNSSGYWGVDMTGFYETHVRGN